VAKATYRRVVLVAVASDLLKVGDSAPDLDVLDANGHEIPLSSFWADRPAVLALLRHFG
jgi:peroxiredoxin